MLDKIEVSLASCIPNAYTRNWHTMTYVGALALTQAPINVMIKVPFIHW